MDNVIVRLAKPIEAHGATITELSLREPTGKDLGGVTGQIGDPAWTHVMISRLAEIPPSSVDKLTGLDWIKCSQVLAGFLVEPAPESSTVISK